MKLKKFLKSNRLAKRIKRIPIEKLHKKSPYEIPVIVSLTSIPSRFDVIPLTVKSILMGDVVPEKIVLWLHSSLKNEIPATLKDTEGRYFEIHFTEGDSPHQKLVNSLEQYPDRLIVTCDDDLIYHRSWLDALYKDHKKYPNDIIAHECRAIVYNEKLEPQPYSFWYREHILGAQHNSILPLGFGGVAYPPKCFHNDVTDENLYMELTPKADDLWFKAMSLRNRTKSRKCSIATPKAIPINNSQEISLRSYNISQDGNLIQWKKLASHFDLDPFTPWIYNEASTPSIHEARKPDSIDAVITWVNGDDPQHQSKLNNYLSSLQGPKPRASSTTRFMDIGELSYCVQSLLKHAPWLNKIYIVSDNQKPEFFQWLQKTPFASKIKLVDHTLLFKGYEEHLPTFNTRSISTMLWRIPGLSEKFLYLNDDFAFIKKTSPEDFFRGDQIVIRGKWRNTWPINLKKNIKKLTNRSSKEQRAKYIDAQMLAARLSGFSSKFFELDHTPHAFHRKTMAKFFESNPGILSDQLQHRFRNSEQYIAESLSAHLEFSKNNAVIDNSKSVLVLKPEFQHRASLKRKLNRAKKSESQTFLCVQSLDKAPKSKQELIFTRLINMIRTI